MDIKQRHVVVIATEDPSLIRLVFYGRDGQIVDIQEVPKITRKYACMMEGFVTWPEPEPKS